MSSAESSPRTYLGSLVAGRIANSEMPPMVRNDACNARIRASSLIATASLTNERHASRRPARAQGQEAASAR